MKLRIVTDGKLFKVQKKVGPFWFDCKVPFGPNASMTKFFNTKAEAERWARERFGIDAEIVNEWRST